MKTTTLALITLLAAALHAADTPAPKAPPPRFISPGDPRRDVAAQKLRGELVSFDPATRTGTFKNTADGTIASFIALPHVICQHHGALGDMSDYRIGERLRFIMHENTDGQWNLLGLVAEELEEIIAHQEPYFVDRIDAEKGILQCTRSNRDKTKIVWPGMMISTDKDTRYWRDGKPDAKFTDIKTGMGLFAKTHGGTGVLERTAWEILLDDASVLHFKEEQIKLHEQRLRADGFPGYVDGSEGHELRLTLFPESTEFIARKQALKKGVTVQLAIAGPDRAARGARISGRITTLRSYIRNTSYISEVTVALDAPPSTEFKPAAVARVWISDSKTILFHVPSAETSFMGQRGGPSNTSTLPTPQGVEACGGKSPPHDTACDGLVLHELADIHSGRPLSAGFLPSMSALACRT